MTMVKKKNKDKIIIITLIPIASPAINKALLLTLPAYKCYWLSEDLCWLINVRSVLCRLTRKSFFLNHCHSCLFPWIFFITCILAWLVLYHYVYYWNKHLQWCRHLYHFSEAEDVDIIYSIWYHVWFNGISSKHDYIILRCFNIWKSHYLVVVFLLSLQGSTILLWEIIHNNYYLFIIILLIIIL